MQLATLLSNHFVMPSMPRVMALLLLELDKPDPNLRRIDQLLSVDPGLAVRVLQAANTGYFKLTGQVHSVTEALAILRMAQVRSLVASSVSQASVTAVPGMPMPQFWRYSLDAARVARSLAGLVRLNQQAAFTCGLIHAVGELAMRMAMTQAVTLDADAEPLDMRRERVERKVFGFSYTEVSAWLARQWQLPQVISNALELAHAPFDNEAYEPLAGVLHLAAWRARARHARLPQNAMTVTFPSLVAEVLGLDIDMVLQQDPIDWGAQMPGRPLI
ncbi:HDOD domain-containing protein [Rhodoferax sp.]|uniref:HDOD domain-containing protein n=1 Tax=Rhodoferax sp. TaxID=50421 RepID=UPI0026191266|nr:HDOD domain-containing protein [Rhodoferax sp.]MDD2924518.1 HDOD domain-containing protein [Rhodoferax sp.]